MADNKEEYQFSASNDTIWGVSNDEQWFGDSIPPIVAYAIKTLNFIKRTFHMVFMDRIFYVIHSKK